MGIITIATDYGSNDGYTAAVIGVIKSLAPQAEIVVATENIRSIEKASLVLLRYYDQYPSGTVHLVIVDPTVGTNRRAIFGFDGKYFFVGPDNGIFSRVILANIAIKWFEIDSLKLPVRKVSPTFHGRDIFAPTAAMLSLGKSPENLGRPIDKPFFISLSEPVIQGGFLIGEIIDIDSFGNLILNITKGKIRGNPDIIMGEIEIPFGRTFADARPGDPVAYIGSLGLLEIAINNGRADELLGAEIGSQVRIKA